MMSFEVHREPLYRRYYAPAASFTCLYAICVGIVLVLLPLFISYNTSTFWIKEQIVYDQPDVDYRYITLIECTGLSESNAEPLSLFYSTSSSINELYSNSLRVPFLSSAVQDDNFDGKTDRLEINVQMPLAMDERITGLTAVVYFDVKISDKAKYFFDAVAFTNFESANSMASITIDGDLLFRQTWPLSGKGGYKVPYESDPLFDVNSGTSAAEVSISTVMKRSTARNWSMVFNPTYLYAVKKGQIGAPQDLSRRGLLTNMFNASITIRVPQQPIRYSPTASVVLSNAWIQYVCFFLITAFVLYRMNSFIFRNQILSSFPVVDIIYEKMQ